MNGSIDRPVFLVGMGRSGTTLVFEALARTRELGWFPNLMDRLPRWTALGALARVCDVSDAFRKDVRPSGQRRHPLEKLRVGPTEAWGAWRRVCGEKFLFDYLLGRQATEEERRDTRAMVRSLLRWAGKPRFAAKFTGPARMGYLLSIFPDARFVHIVRDGRSVVDSLLHVEFWADTFRLTEPAWSGGLNERYLRVWEEHDREPAILAALEWRSVIERMWEERDAHRPDVFHEMRYEDFVADPAATLRHVCAAADLSFPPSAWSWLEGGAGIRPVKRAPGERLPPPVRDRVEALLADLLEHYGYRTDTRKPARSSPADPG